MLRLASLDPVWILFEFGEQLFLCKFAGLLLTYYSASDADVTDPPADLVLPPVAEIPDLVSVAVVL